MGIGGIDHRESDEVVRVQRFFHRLTIYHLGSGGQKLFSVRIQRKGTYSKFTFVHDESLNAGNGFGRRAEELSITGRPPEFL